jgi:hypothetical protein
MATEFNDNLSRILGLIEGREVLRAILELSGIMPGAGAGMSEARTLGLWLWQEILSVDSKYLQMIANKSIEEQSDGGRDDEYSDQ